MAKRNNRRLPWILSTTPITVIVLFLTRMEAVWFSTINGASSYCRGERLRHSSRVRRDSSCFVVVLLVPFFYFIKEGISFSYPSACSVSHSVNFSWCTSPARCSCLRVCFFFPSPTLATSFVSFFTRLFSLPFLSVFQSFLFWRTWLMHFGVRVCSTSSWERWCMDPTLRPRKQGAKPRNAETQLPLRWDCGCVACRWEKGGCDSWRSNWDRRSNDRRSWKESREACFCDLLGLSLTSPLALLASCFFPSIFLCVCCLHSLLIFRSLRPIILPNIAFSSVTSIMGDRWQPLPSKLRCWSSSSMV